MVELIEEERRVRVVADRHEEPVRFDLADSPVTVSRSRTPVTFVVPEHLLDALLSTNSIFSSARARSTMIGEARNSSRRWTR